MRMHSICSASSPVRRATPSQAIELIGRAIAINPAIASTTAIWAKSYRRSVSSTLRLASLHAARWN